VNRNGKRKPLVWCFNRPQVELQRCLAILDPDQPIIALQSGSRVLPYTEDTVRRTARHHLNELLKLFPEGGIALGGNCHGARVARQIAAGFEEKGLPVERLILLEYFDESLFDFPGKLMLLFGRQSKFRAYRPLLRSGLTGWRKRFRREPVVLWTPGTHGGFFLPGNVEPLLATVERFLKDIPQGASASERFWFTFLLAVHRVRILRSIYFSASKRLRRHSGGAAKARETAAAE
jgi:thioesterase domain-containing protein